MRPCQRRVPRFKTGVAIFVQPSYLWPTGLLNRGTTQPLYRWNVSHCSLRYQPLYSLLTYAMALCIGLSLQKIGNKSVVGWGMEVFNWGWFLRRFLRNAWTREGVSPPPKALNPNILPTDGTLARKRTAVAVCSCTRSHSWVVNMADIHIRAKPFLYQQF